MPTRREVPRNFEPGPDDDLAETGPSYVYIGHSSTRAFDDMQALMECEPFEDPDVSQLSLLPLRDIIADALDELTDEERWMFDAFFVRKLSERQLSAEIQIPKTTLRRRKEKVLDHLRDRLVSNPHIAEYLGSSAEA